MRLLHGWSSRVACSRERKRRQKLRRRRTSQHVHSRMASPLQSDLGGPFIQDPPTPSPTLSNIEEAITREKFSRYSPLLYL